MSIPAVSLVNFIDNETCSYPVEVLDISKRGVRIQFKHPAPLMREKIAKATGFEVVFAVPDSSLTVALRCTPKRFAAGERTWLAGVFRKECEPVLSMMSKCFEGKGGEAPVVT